MGRLVLATLPPSSPYTNLFFIVANLYAVVLLSSYGVASVDVELQLHDGFPGSLLPVGL